MRILFLDLDTLRPDHLGCYGYHRNTSPAIDSVAVQGVRFDNYYCSDAPCLPSRTALMTGRFGIHTGVVNHGGSNADVRPDGSSRGFRDRLYSECLPGLLRRAGLTTVSISPFAERHASWSFYAGFSEMHNTGGRGIESAEQITPTALRWIEDNAGRDNWFLHVNYWDAHTPYRAPASFGNPFAGDPLPQWLTDDVLRGHRNSVGPHCAHEISMYNNVVDRGRFPRQPGEILTMNHLREMIDGYDCGIGYMDSHIAKILDALKKKGVYEDLAIIISSDHGENQGELGIYGEHATADHATCRIPMIVRWPGAQAGRIDRGLHYNLDLAPTLAELLGLEPAGRWDGASYARSVLRGEDCGRRSLVVSQCAHVCQRGVRMGDWMYVRTYHDGYHLFPREMLYDLACDPHEQTNLAAERSDVCRDAVYHLTEWHDHMMSTMESDVDPLWTVIREGGPMHAKGMLARYVPYLEQTGRGWAVPELKKRHPREFA